MAGTRVPALPHLATIPTRIRVGIVAGTGWVPLGRAREVDGRARIVAPMRATSIGHAGILVETHAGSILCDPWFVPAFHGSWFPFPRNDQLSDDLLARIEGADFLYVSHLHGDHHDEPWLLSHLRRDIPILLPGFPTKEQQRTLAALGFTEFIRTVDTEETEIAPGLRVAIHMESSITDGPGGDSALVVMDGESILVDQNDCRTNDLGQLNAHGPVDLHFLQFSGAIWYPMVYEMPDDEKARLCKAKVEAQFARALRYVEKIDARYVVPSAGPPCFLDEDLFPFNVITGDEPSIFPDQREFLSRLGDGGHQGLLNIPGTVMDVSPEGVKVTHPLPQAEVKAIFTEKEAYLRRYQADWKPWLDDLKAGWTAPSTDLLPTLKEWWEPLLEMAPTLRSQVGANMLLRAGDLDVLVDFPAGEVRAWDGEPYAFRFDIARELVETVVADRAVDWSNSLLLSLRFTAWRESDFNEYVYNFLKSLSRPADAAGRGRGGAQAHARSASWRRPASPTSASVTTSSSAAARTATPTWPPSARSTAASWSAPSTAGASTSTPASASLRPTTPSASAPPTSRPPPPRPPGPEPPHPTHLATIPTRMRVGIVARTSRADVSRWRGTIAAMTTPRPTEPRIPPLAAEDMDERQRALMEQVGLGGPTVNIFATLVRHPGLFRRWLPFGGKLLAGRLPARDRELLVLRTGWRCRSEYEWAQHVVVGRRPPASPTRRSTGSPRDRTPTAGTTVTGSCCGRPTSSTTTPASPTPPGPPWPSATTSTSSSRCPWSWATTTWCRSP